mgnify:CR=1 FL=1
MADVFISYKREERQAVERLAQELRLLGIDVWFDASLNAGEAFSDEIDREARAAKAILVCWSPAARASDWVKAEALIGFTNKKLAACYAAGPDGFDPPAPFNATHAEDMRAWLAAPSHTHAGWKSVLRRVGKLCGREDIESYGALDVQAPAAALRSWLTQHEASPLFMAVDELLRVRDDEEAELTRLEREARERRTREEAERRARAEAEQFAHEDQERRQRAERELRLAQQREAELAGASARRGQRTPFALSLGGGLLALIAVLIWSPWNDGAPAPDTPDTGETAAIVDSTATLRDGQMFRDCDSCPEMVVIPAGSFTMGSSESEANRSADEGPQRRVVLQRFAAGKYEVSRGEWTAFVNATNRAAPPNDCYTTTGQDGSWRSPGFAQDDNHPVTCVRWQDARDYAAWLSRETGHGYQLLTEAEWEYAARAGTTTAYSTGGAITAAQARFNSNSTIAVGSFEPNAFGLHDVHGNVWEWVQDCYANPYPSAPANGSAYDTSGCSSRVLRGGSWNNIPQYLRSADRSRFNPTYRFNYDGFRVARTV